MRVTKYYEYTIIVLQIIETRPVGMNDTDKNIVKCWVHQKCKRNVNAIFRLRIIKRPQSKSINVNCTLKGFLLKKQ